MPFIDQAPFCNIWGIFKAIMKTASCDTQPHRGCSNLVPPQSESQKHALCPGLATGVRPMARMGVLFLACRHSPAWGCTGTRKLFGHGRCVLMSALGRQLKKEGKELETEETRRKAGDATKFTELRMLKQKQKPPGRYQLPAPLPGCSTQEYKSSVGLHG